MSHLKIGEIEFSSGQKNKQATLSCSLPKNFELTLKLFDKYGICCRTETFQPKGGRHELAIDCSELEEGDYSAWIELDGKTYLRGFRIAGKKRKKGIFRRLMEMLQPSEFREAYY